MKKYANEYEQAARDFLKKANTTIKITRSEIVDRFWSDEKPTGYRWKYRITLKRNNRYYTFNFYDSINSYNNDQRPGAYDILASVEKYEPAADIWDFASEYGYSINCREDFQRVERIRRACEKQYQKLLSLFGYDLLEELREIN